jgi:stage III sporulation protein AD
MIGVVAALLSVFIRKERAEFSLLLGMIAGIVIFYGVLTQISVVVNFVTQLLDMVTIEENYYFQLLKMLGVAYVSEFASNICKDAGQHSVAGMVELFAKISIVVLSIPGLVFLIETLEKFI